MRPTSSVRLPGLDRAGLSGVWSKHTSGGRFRDWFALFREVRCALDPLWPPGLILVCLLTVDSLFVVEGKSKDWAFYLVVGTVFPPLAWLLGDRPLARPAVTGRDAVKLLLAGLVLIWVPWGLPLRNPWLLGGCLLQSFVILTLRPAKRLMEASVLYWISVAAWTLIPNFRWWGPFWSTVVSSTYGIGVVAIVTLAIFGWMFVPSRSSLRGSTGTRFADLVAVGCFVFASVQIPIPSAAELAWIHWPFWTDPAALVQQGGFLLWDVPSQYGFLSILTVASFPGETPWESFHWFVATGLFVSACGLYALLVRFRGGLVGRAMALPITLIVTFLATGWPTGPMSGPSPVPNVAPFRFLWCFALLAILLWNRRRPPNDARIVWLTGCSVWLIGVLWSAESAVWCSIVWLPAYAILVFARRVEIRGGRLVFWLALPGVFLFAAGGVLSFDYLWALGHLPDWKSFYEYVLPYNDHFFVMAIDRRGWHAMALFSFAACSTLCVRGIDEVFRNPERQAELALQWGAWAMFWAVTSYTIRGNPGTFTPMAFPFCISLFTVLLPSGREPSWRSVCVRTAVFPFLPVVLSTFLLQPAELGEHIRHSTDVLDAQGVRQRLGTVPHSLQVLLDTAEVRSTDPIVVLDVNPVLPEVTLRDGVLERKVYWTQAWMPVPLLMMFPLPSERRQLYLARFHERRRLSGWLIERKTHEHVLDEMAKMVRRLHLAGEDVSFGWIRESLKRTHVVTRRFENDQWILEWYEALPR